MMVEKTEFGDVVEFEGRKVLILNHNYRFIDKSWNVSFDRVRQIRIGNKLATLPSRDLLGFLSKNDEFLTESPWDPSTYQDVCETKVIKHPTVKEKVRVWSDYNFGCKAVFVYCDGFESQFGKKTIVATTPVVYL